MLEQINICFASDDNYVKHMGAAIVSIIKNTSNYCNFYIISDNISDENKEKIEKIKKIKEFTIYYVNGNNGDFKALQRLVGHTARATYYRLKMASYFQDINKIIYLDCDLIAVDDIYDLWSVDVSQHYIAAVRDVRSSPRTKRLEIVSEYINAGVLLANLQLWREDNMEEKLLSYARKYNACDKYMRCDDQDVINSVFQEKVKVLPDRYNYQYVVPMAKYYIDRPDYLKTPLQNPLIVHFIGIKKPWNSMEVSEKYATQYWKCFLLTPWQDEYVKPRKIVRIAKKVKIWVVKNFKAVVLKICRKTNTEKYLRKIQELLIGK